MSRIDEWVLPSGEVMFDLGKIFGRTPRILVVDDDPGSADLLARLLRSCGSEVGTAATGSEGLAKVGAWRPDLVMLDVLLPDVDGFEVCRSIRHLEAGFPIPIVMVTALSSRDDRNRGLESGADDFISKPFDRTQVVARAKSLLRIKFLFDEVSLKNAELDEKNRLLGARNTELLELQKLKENLVHMIVHDLKNPVTAILLDIEMILMRDRTDLSEGAAKRIGRIEHEADRLQGMLLDLLDISRMEEGRIRLKREPLDLTGLCRDKLGRFVQTFSSRLENLEFHCDAEGLIVTVDGRILERILDNLLHNAVKFCSPRAAITVTLESPRPGLARLTISDDGPGVPMDKLDRIFEKFYRIEAVARGGRCGSGLGLNFCKLAVESHGGRIWAESDGERGTAFVIELPAHSAVRSEAPHPGGGETAQP